MVEEAEQKEVEGEAKGEVVINFRILAMALPDILHNCLVNNPISDHE